MSDDDIWIADIFGNAQPALDEPRIQILLLFDYEDALRYVRVFRIRSDNGLPLDVDIERSLQSANSSGFVAHWIPVPWGVIAFCGVFFHGSSGVVSSSFAVFSQDDAMKPQILAMLHRARQKHRQIMKMGLGLPIPLDGLETN
jgi:hypothetical protein